MTEQKQQFRGWLANEAKAYRLPFIEPPKSIADIGANEGAFSVMAKETWPDSTVIAFEPYSKNFKSLRSNVAGLSGVTATRAALRSFTGTDRIHVGDMGVTCGFHSLGRQTSKRETVPCLSAGEIGSPEFVKIDTEGCEIEILGAMDLSGTKAIALEYHRQSDIDLIKELLASRGLDLWIEKPASKDVGQMVFARDGVLPKRSKKVFVAIPAYGQIPVNFANCVTKMILEPPCSLVVKWQPGDSLVSRARNTLTADFLESDCTHLLFIDSDLVFSSEQIARMVEHDVPIVGGFYPKKQDGNLEWVCNAKIPNPEPDERGLHSLRYIGTGFMLIKREVFDAMIVRYGESLAYFADGSGRPEHDFWSVGVHRGADGRGRFLSEDWFFCQRCLDMGLEVLGDTRVRLKHIGTATFPLRSQEIAAGWIKEEVLK